MKKENVAFLKSLSENYSKDKAQDTFEVIKARFNESGDNDYLAALSYFNDEERVSYYLFRETHRLYLMESLLEMNKTENKHVLSSLKTMSYRYFIVNAFRSNSLMLSRAACDGYQEVLGDDYDQFVNEALIENERLIKKLFTTCKLRAGIFSFDVFEEVNVHFTQTFSHSVFRVKLMEQLKKVGGAFKNKAL